MSCQGEVHQDPPLAALPAPAERNAASAGQQDSPCWQQHQSDDDKYRTERSRPELNCAVSRRCWRQEVRRWVACHKGMVLTAGCERRGGITWRRLSVSASWPAGNLVTGRQYCSSEGNCCPAINSDPSKISEQQVCTPTASYGLSDAPQVWAWQKRLRGTGRCISLTSRAGSFAE